MLRADFDRLVPMRAQDIDDLLTAITDDGGTAPFPPLTAGADHIQAGHLGQLQGAVQGLWNGQELGQLPTWGGGLAPGGPSAGTAQTPIYLSDIADLRSALNRYEQATSKAIHGWGNPAGSLVVANQVHDNRGLPQQQGVPHLVTTSVPGQFLQADRADAGTSGQPATAFGYDPIRRPTQRVQPDGSSQFLWQYAAWTTTLVDENGHQRVQTRDGLGRLAEVDDYRGVSPNATLFQRATYAYTVADQLLTVTDGTGSNHTQLAYDSLGRKTQVSDPDLGTWGYAYDVEGRLTALTQAGPTVLANTYDGDGLRLARTAGSATTHFVGDWYEYNVTTGVATVYCPLDGQAVAMKAGGALSLMDDNGCCRW